MHEASQVLGGDGCFDLPVGHLVLQTGGSSTTSQIPPLHVSFPSVGVTMATDGPKFLDGDEVVRI